MSALWQALDEIEHYYRSRPGDDDDLTDEPVRVAIPRPAVRVVRRTVTSAPANPDALTDAPSNVALTEKAVEALHPCPIRAHERQMAMVASGDPQAVALHRAVSMWYAQRAAVASLDEEATK